MKNKLNYMFLIVGLFTLAGCATGQRPPAPILACNAEQLLGKEVLQQAVYRKDAPERYIVQRGDTLWGIAGRFLHSPSRWKEIWYKNPQIRNPHLIYPGDVISYVTVNGERRLQVAGSSNPARSRYIGRKTADGRPIYRLSPTIRTKALNEPIPTLPKEAVYPFITKNRIIEAELSQHYPYVVSPAKNNALSLSAHQEIFAKGDHFEAELYDVFREAGKVFSPITKKSNSHNNKKPIGTEVTYVGQLELIKAPNEDGVATFRQTEQVNPLMPLDILIPSTEVQAGGDLFFMPQLPQPADVATIIKPIGTSTTQTASQFSTILISSNNPQGLAEGTVFKIVRTSSVLGKDREGKPIRLPTENIGHVMVYQSFGKLSYALILDSTEAIYPGDCLVSP